LAITVAMVEKAAVNAEIVSLAAEADVTAEAAFAASGSEISFRSTS